MSIYISGLNLPPKGEYTDVRIFSDGWAHKATAEPPLYNRAYEAINVNPHGRMIDADAFLARNAYFADREFVNPKYDDTLKDLIDRADTIIPADGGDGLG